MLTLVAVFAVELALAQVSEPTPPPPPPQVDSRLPLSQTSQPVRECAVALDCGEGATCESGKCYRWCNTTRECGAGLKCLGHQRLPTGQWTKGVCSAGVRGDPCTERRDCGRGFVCEGAVVPRGESSCVPEGTAPLDGSAPLTRTRQRYRGSVPPGFRLVTEPLPGLIAGGSTAFAVAYVLPILAGALNRDASGAIPLVGPFLVAGNAWSGSGGWSIFADFFLALGAAVAAGWQGVGIGMVIAGFAGGHKSIEPVPTPGVTLVPSAPGSLAGASLVGHF